MNTEEKQGLYGELRRIIAEVGGIPADFSPQAHFYHELGIPSVKALHLLMTLEERYGVRIEDETFVEAVSLERLYALMVPLVSS